MGITVAKASTIPNPAQEASLSSRLNTATPQKAGTTTAASSPVSKKRTGKEKNSFGAMVRGFSGERDSDRHETHARSGSSATGATSTMVSDPSGQGSTTKSSSASAAADKTAQESADTQNSAQAPTFQLSLSDQEDDASSPKSASVQDTTQDQDADSVQSSSDPAADAGQQIQNMQGWPALMLAQTVMPVQVTTTQAPNSTGSSATAAAGTASAATMTSGTAQAGTILSASAALSAIMTTLASASGAQAAPSAQSMPTAAQSTASQGGGRAEKSLLASQQAQVAAAAQGNDTASIPAPDTTATANTPGTATAGGDIVQAAVGQATVPVNASGSAVAAPLSSSSRFASIHSAASSTTTTAPSAQSVQTGDGTAASQSSQTASVSNVTVQTSARMDSRDGLASLSASPDHTASTGYNAVTAPSGEAVANAEQQGGLSDHSEMSGDDRGEDTQKADAPTPTNITLSSDLSAPTAFSIEHAGQTADTEATQTLNQADGDDEVSSQFVSSPGISRSADGRTSVSMTIMTGDSTPVHVHLEGTDGVTTGIVLQSEDEATARHLANNRHELVTALGATGMEVNNLKIDVVAATDNGANLNDQGAGNGATYDGSASGGMSGNGAGQNGGQSFSGSAWGSGFVSPAQGGVDIDGGTSDAATGAGRTYAGSGINITA